MSTVASELDGRIAAEVDGARDLVVDTRRAIHRHPEISSHEAQTAELVARRSSELGFTVRTGVGAHGVIADLDSGRPGPCVMLRADTDALPIIERGERVVTSEVEGAMHACGHDGHVAMALGAGATLAALRDTWSGRLRLCFQPEEETATGAMPMIEAGAADGVDHVFGIHLWAPLQVGRVAITPSVLFGSADSVRIVVHGRGGHGGMPHTAIDPVIAAAHVLVALQTIVSRETSPFSPVVITFGRIEGGTAMNVIADSVELLGTTRALEQSERERVHKRIAEVAGAVAYAFGAMATYEVLAGCPPVVNNSAMAGVVRDAAVRVVGEDHVDVAQPVTVGDDVACFLQRAPGCYFLVGAGHPERGPVAPHHSAEFDIDEDALPIGVETLVRAALRMLVPSRS